jgi:uncharacterized membrane protein
MNLKEQMKFREMLDKLGIRVDMLRQGESELRDAIARISERVEAIELGKKTNRRGTSGFN